METKTIDRKIIEQLKNVSGKEKIGEGTYGTVYKYKNNTALKLFYKEEKPLKIDEDGIKEVLSFENLNLDGLSFFVRTMYILSDKKGIYGQVMPYIKGFTIERTPRLKTIQMLDINIASQNLENEILETTRRKILLSDFSISNVIYTDSRKFAFVDCAATEYNVVMSPKSIKRRNLIDLNETFSKFIENAYPEDHKLVKANESRLIDDMKTGKIGIREYSTKVLTLQMPKI